MRLLIVTTVAVSIRAFLLPYAQHFRGRGWQVDAMAAGIETCAICRETFDSLHEVSWSRRPAGNWNLVAVAGRVRRKILAGQYDIVHVHTPVASFITRCAIASIPRARRPLVIYTVHGFHFQAGNPWFENLLYKTLERLAAHWTDFLITINSADTAAALDMQLVPATRIERMPGIGVDRRIFNPEVKRHPEVSCVLREFAIASDAPLFVMIAEFLPRKRHLDLIQAFCRIRNDNTQLLFVGGGPTLSAIRRLAAECRAHNRIHFAGPQNDVRPFILAARATVLPSSQEGLPRSILESLCCGIPVIGSDIRGIRDLLSEGGGALFPCGDIDRLAYHLDWFAENAEAAREIGLRASGNMPRYDIEHLLALHEQLYDRALVKHRRVGN